jgi:hypothetical protein
MAEPKALGMVLAMLVDPGGKPVRGGAAKGQLYVSPEEIVVLRPSATEDLLDRVALALLFGSVLAVVANVALWKSTAVLWGAIAAQAIYWISLPARRRRLEPRPLTAGDLEVARRGGRAALSIPATAVAKRVAPEPPRSGFRRPARFELPEGALEIYLSAEQFAEVEAALGRRG